MKLNSRVFRSKLFFSVLVLLAVVLGISWVPMNELDAESVDSLWLNSTRREYEPFRVAGYLPDYQITQVPRDILDTLTDVIYFAVAPLSDGGLQWSRYRDYHLERLHSYQDDHDFRLHLGIADHSYSYEWEGFKVIVGSDELITQFAKNLTDILLSYGFDGADIDWEWPRGEEQVIGFTKLLETIRSEFDQHGLELSIAVSRYFPIEGEAYDYVDHVNLMAYDEPGRHSTTENSWRNFEVLTDDQGARRSQVLLGVPFYGRGYGAGQGPEWGDAMTYRTLRQKYQVKPDQDTAEGYYFNGINTILSKVDMAWAGGAGGIMIWEIGQDSYDEYSLLTAISDVVERKEQRIFDLNL